MAAGLVDIAGNVHRDSSVPTDHSLDSESLYADLVGLVESVLGSDVSYDVCGVGCGGPMSPGGQEVSPLNIPAWRNFALVDRMRESFGARVVIDNDAKALALGEAWYGAGIGLSNFLAMVVSTGIGGGLIMNGELIEGATGNAGHIGHVIVEPEGAICACGSQGCLEAEASGPSIARRLKSEPSEASIFERSRAGTMVGRAVASAVNLLDLERVLVGGSVALGFGVPFFKAANSEMIRRCGLDFSRGVKIVPVGLGGKAPIVGAAAIGFRGLGINLRKSTSD